MVDFIGCDVIRWHCILLNKHSICWAKIEVILQQKSHSTLYMEQFSQPIPFPLDSGGFYFVSWSVLCFAAIVCVVHGYIFLLQAAGWIHFQSETVFYFNSVGRFSSFHHILQMKLCSPPGTLPSHSRMNVSQFKMWPGWNAKPATFHYLGDFFLCIFNFARIFFMWAFKGILAVSPRCFLSAFLYQFHKVTQARRTQHVNTWFRDTNTSAEMSVCTPRDTSVWYFDRERCSCGNLHHFLMSNRLFAGCLFPPLTFLTCDWAPTSTAAPPNPLPSPITGKHSHWLCSRSCFISHFSQ